MIRFLFFTTIWFSVVCKIFGQTLPMPPSGFKPRSALETISYDSFEKKSLDAASDSAQFKFHVKYLPEKKAWRLYFEKKLPGLEARFLEESTEMKQLGVPLDKPALSRLFSFSDSMDFREAARVRVAPFRNGQPFAPETLFTFHQHLGLGKKVLFEPKYDARYAAAGDLGLSDGLKGSPKFDDGTWLAWQNSDMSAVLDLGAPTDVFWVSVNFLQASESWVLLPSTVDFYTSDNGQEWQLAWSNAFKINAFSEKTIISPSIWEAPAGTNFRFLKIVAHNPGVFPEGHKGAGGVSWIFADEIIIK